MKYKKNIVSSSALALLLMLGFASPNPALAQDETDAGSYLAGQFARSNGDVDVAINALRRTYQENPDNLDIAGQLEGLLLLQGSVGAAIDMASGIHQQDDKDQLSDLLLVIRYIKNDSPDNAAAMLSSAFDSGNAQLWLPLVSAWIDVARHKLDKPLSMDDLSATISRAAPLANYHLALINAQAGFTDAAALNFKNAIEDPQNPPQRVMSMLLQFYKQNNKPEALTPIVDAYRAAHPENEADIITPPVSNAKDGIAEVLYTMGGVMLGAESHNEAVLYMQLALYLKPDFPEAATGLGDAYVELQQYARANEAYAKILPGTPFYERAQLRIAINYDHMGKLKEALAMLDKIAKQSPENPDALITKGDLLRMHNNYRDAIAAYTQALARVPKLAPSQWPILFARGTCYERLGNWPLAQRDMQQALLLKPDQPDVLNYLGYGWMERSENMADARAMIEKAIKARPDDAEIIDSMGWALYLSGDYDGAVDYLEKAVELLPGDATVNDHLGDIYWRLGHKNEARYQWQRALGFSPDAKEAASLHRKLKDGLPPPSAMANTAPADMDGAAAPGVAQ